MDKLSEVGCPPVADSDAYGTDEMYDEDLDDKYWDLDKVDYTPEVLMLLALVKSKSCSQRYKKCGGQQGCLCQTLFYNFHPSRQRRP